MKLRVRTVVPVVMALVVSVAASGAEATRGVRVKPVTPTGEPTLGDNWLLIVAIGKYEEWDSLRGPRKDAEGIKKVLVDRYDFAPEHVVELYDEKAGAANINRTLRELIGKLGPSDSLLVYYAGHGYTDLVSGTGYWIPHDAGRDELAHERWLPNTEIRGLLRAMKCKHVLLVSDSCFSGDMLKEHRGRKRRIDEEYYRRAYAMASRQVLTSGASEPVSDTDLGGHSAFAFQLIQTLEQNTKPYLDPTELHVYVRAGIEGQQPLVGTLKHAGHQEGGSYLLFLRQGPAPAERKQAQSEAEKKEAAETAVEKAALAAALKDLEKLKEQMAAKGKAEDEVVAARQAFEKIVTGVAAIRDPGKKTGEIYRLRAKSLIDLAGTPYDERLVAMAEMERVRAARVALASDLPTGSAAAELLAPPPEEPMEPWLGSPRLSVVIGAYRRTSGFADQWGQATCRFGRGANQLELAATSAGPSDNATYGFDVGYCHTWRGFARVRPFVRAGIGTWGPPDPAAEGFQWGGFFSTGLHWYASEKLSVGAEGRLGMPGFDGAAAGLTLGYSW